MDTPTRPPVPDPGAPDGHDARSLGDLFRALSNDASALVRQEIALARTEVKQSVTSMAADAVKIVLGAILAGLGGLVLLAALVVSVGDLLGDRYALGALIVGLVLLAGGGVLALMGLRDAKKTKLAPEQALSSLRDTGEWARGEVSGIRSALGGHAAADSGTATLGRPIASGGASGGHSGGGQAQGGSRGGTSSMPHGGSPDEPAPLPGPAARTWSESDYHGLKKADIDRARKKQERLPAGAPLWKRVMKEFSADDLSNQAAKVAYFFFGSLPPLIMALFGLTGVIGGQKTGDWLTGRLTSSLPAEASGLVMGFVNDIVHKNAPGPISIGLLLALWAGSNIFSTLEDTLNQVFSVPAERSFIKKKLVAVGMLVACSLLFITGSAVLLGGGKIADALGLGEAGRIIWAVAQIPLAFALITATFWLIYYVLPLKDQSKCKKTLLKASAIVTVLFVLASLAFRFYVTNFGSQTETYGLLGTVIVLLLWMYVTSLVILLGGEVASEMERGS
ncbi:YihY family inner membrane protein [Longimicrobium terrae]|uniref:YihY family inner membrane protein n=2 Tax=Longimicrobium terrae TaxID=1639882 RepID=A0A841GU39_9BACT|nr:YhjD/YihY/BrkB family envelope integrity protein [Longimicrobium terrae]MBB6068403.1 YihY family inner membrane protein [Longimicrobium terrae]NNC32683.1 YihY family inner membrane protein [Longimicrobium terrae]